MLRVPDMLTGEDQHTYRTKRYTTTEDPGSQQAQQVISTPERLVESSGAVELGSCLSSESTSMIPKKRDAADSRLRAEGCPGLEA